MRPTSRFSRPAVLFLLLSVFVLACAGTRPGPSAATTPTSPPAAPAALPADLQGLLNAHQPEPQLLVSGQPTAAEIAALGRAGYRSVIDLRPPQEARGFDEKAAVATAGLRYENLPVTLPTLDAAAVDRFLAVFRSAPRPVLLHCATANRAGALYYAWLVLERGVEPGAALERARAAGLQHPELVTKISAVVAERTQPPAQ